MRTSSARKSNRYRTNSYLRTTSCSKGSTITRVMSPMARTNHSSKYNITLNTMPIASKEGSAVSPTSGSSSLPVRTCRTWIWVNRNSITQILNSVLKRPKTRPLKVCRRSQASREPSRTWMGSKIPVGHLIGSTRTSSLGRIARRSWGQPAHRRRRPRTAHQAHTTGTRVKWSRRMSWIIRSSPKIMI